MDSSVLWETRTRTPDAAIARLALSSDAAPGAGVAGLPMTQSSRTHAKAFSARWISCTSHRTRRKRASAARESAVISLFTISRSRKTDTEAAAPVSEMIMLHTSGGSPSMPFFLRGLLRGMCVSEKATSLK